MQPSVYYQKNWFHAIMCVVFCFCFHMDGNKLSWFLILLERQRNSKVLSCLTCRVVFQRNHRSSITMHGWNAGWTYWVADWFCCMHAWDEFVWNYIHVPPSYGVVISDSDVSPVIHLHLWETACFSTLFSAVDGRLRTNWMLEKICDAFIIISLSTTQPWLDTMMSGKQFQPSCTLIDIFE